MATRVAWTGRKVDTSDVEMQMRHGMSQNHPANAQDILEQQKRPRDITSRVMRFRTGLKYISDHRASLRAAENCRVL
jgi:hypothetical protein